MHRTHIGIYAVRLQDVIGRVESGTKTEITSGTSNLAAIYRMQQIEALTNSVFSVVQIYLLVASPHYVLSGRKK